MLCHRHHHDRHHHRHRHHHDRHHHRHRHDRHRRDRHRRRVLAVINVDLLCALWHLANMVLWGYCILLWFGLLCFCLWFVLLFVLILFCGFCCFFVFSRVE